MSVCNLSKIQKAETLVAKTFGVIGWKSFGHKNGLLLTKTNSIHTFFVRFPLDVVYLTEDLVVIKTVKNLSPFRISPIIWSAKHVLEMPKGSIAKYKLEKGQKINLV